MPVKGIPTAMPGVTGGPDDSFVNPFLALLPQDRIREFQALPVEKRREFYGRVVESMFSDPGYQKVAYDTAAREFDRMTGKG